MSLRRKDMPKRKLWQKSCVKGVGNSQNKKADWKKKGK